MAYLAEIPYGAYWSTPFAKWQGSFANLHSVEFAAHVAKGELAKRRIAADAFDYGVLGMTVPQKSSFYGLPWFMGLIGGRKVGAGMPQILCDLADLLSIDPRVYSLYQAMLGAVVGNTILGGSHLHTQFFRPRFKPGAGLVHGIEFRRKLRPDVCVHQVIDDRRRE